MFSRIANRECPDLGLRCLPRPFWQAYLPYMCIIIIISYCSDVADLTGAPEMLGGRVKTLHPAIHGGKSSPGVIKLFHQLN